MTELRVYVCTLCDWSGQIPSDAVQLTNGFAGKPIVYKFGDGTVHSIKKQRVKKEETIDGIPNKNRS
jgi:hypothetical protein